MDPNQTTTAFYVSVSHEKGTVKTSCSANVTLPNDIAHPEDEVGVAMMVAMGAATLAAQAMPVLLAEPVDPAQLRAFVAGVRAVAATMVEGW